MERISAVGERPGYTQYVPTYLVYLWMDCIIGKRCAYRVREGVKWNYISLRLLHSILAVSHFKEKGGNYCCCSASERERERQRWQWHIGYNLRRVSHLDRSPRSGASKCSHAWRNREGRMFVGVTLFFRCCCCCCVWKPTNKNSWENIGKKCRAAFFFVTPGEREKVFFSFFIINLTQITTFFFSPLLTSVWYRER